MARERARPFLLLVASASTCACWRCPPALSSLRDSLPAFSLRLGGGGGEKGRLSLGMPSCLSAKMDVPPKFKRNPLIGVLGYLQLLPRGTGQVVLNKPDSDSAPSSGGEAAQALSGTAVARELRKSITALYSEFVTVDGDGVDYSSLRASQEFKEYTSLAAQLARVDPLTMERKERLAFFINVYNSLTIHAVATLGAPADLLSRLRLYAEASYLIGSNTFSLNDIENGILRGNRAPPTINPLPKRPFSENDPRMSLAFEEVDARIHFALNCAARSCPPIRFYKPESVSEELDAAARAFCRTVRVQATPEPRVTLSEIFKWYAADFAPKGASSSHRETLKYITQFVGVEEQASLTRLLEQHPDSSSGLKDIVTYEPYDWGLNSK